MLSRIYASVIAVTVLSTTLNAQLPSTGYVDSYGGVNLSGQCVPNARALGEKFVGRSLPFLGGSGVAADLWTASTTSFNAIARLSRTGGVKMPPPYSFIVWSRDLGGTGHVAMVIGPVDGTKKIVRVVDTNWGSTGKGQIHDVDLNNAKILGYLVRN